MEESGKVRLIFRPRQPRGIYKFHYRMVEDPADRGEFKKWVFINPEEFLTVEEDESVIFWSGSRGMYLRSQQCA